ncbi:hypothetical protein G6F50_015794 [Rhizopus delemar]|uniref:Uncharacterized protein n=1 Tax=Rhizopus delemar TaxID=936053 RepID=A0A9P6XWU2_9FUNG|nr:hypothetical protein G6F50_015794 [Rhizopus delemar]
MLFQRNVLQCLVDARQQLAVNAAHQQVQVGGERAFEGLQLQRAAEVSPDHRLQCRFQANCDIGSAGFNGHQCCPLGVRPAIDDGQCASFQLCNIVREAPSVPAGQDGPAAAEGSGGNKVGAGLVQWPDRADDQDQVGIAPASRD